MKQQRLEVPQRTLYGVHRHARFYNRDPHSNVPFADHVPPMQKWEVVAWSIIAGLLFLGAGSVHACDLCAVYRASDANGANASGFVFSLAGY